MQREEPVASAGFLRAQLRESWGRPAAVAVGRQPIAACRDGEDRPSGRRSDRTAPHLPRLCDLRSEPRARPQISGKRALLTDANPLIAKKLLQACR